WWGGGGGGRGRGGGAGGWIPRRWFTGVAVGPGGPSSVAGSKRKSWTTTCGPAPPLALARAPRARHAKSTPAAVAAPIRRRHRESRPRRAMGSSLHQLLHRRGGVGRGGRAHAGAPPPPPGSLPARRARRVAPGEP